jgi:hypothetical protein
MNMRAHQSIAFTLATIAALACGAAFGADEEIQVYMDELGKPGEFGLDVHTSYVASGDLVVDYPGNEPSLHRLRVTPEFAYGLTNSLELGVYLPLATLDRDGQLGLGGIKFRLKYIAPRAPEDSWFWGANLELGRVNHSLDANPVNGELKGIAGTRSGPWTLAFNANVGFKVSGPEPSPATFELATKLMHSIGNGASLGIESFNGMGELRSPGHFGDSEQAGFIVLDKSIGRWELNLGAGMGYGTSPDRLILKAIIGVPID